MKNSPYLFLPIIMLFLFINSNVLAQEDGKAFFTVEGEVSNPLKITLEELLKMKQHEIETKNLDGEAETFKSIKVLFSPA